MKRCFFKQEKTILHITVVHPEKLEKIRAEIRDPHFSMFLPKSVDAEIVIKAWDKEAETLLNKKPSKNYFRKEQVTSKRNH